MSVPSVPVPNPVDLLFHGAGQSAVHPEAVPNVGAVLHLSGTAPDLDALVRHVAPRIGTLPCLTHRLVDSGPAVHWARQFPDTARHITAHSLPRGVDHLDTAVRDLLREPLPDAAPAWRLCLLTGHTPDGYTLLYLTHHAVQDAAGIFSVLEALFGPPIAPSQSSGVAPRIADGPAPGAVQMVRSVRHTLRNTRRHGLWTAPDRPLSARRDVLWADVPTGVLRTAGRTLGCSPNDIHLTALAHAVAEWAQEHWPRAAHPALPVMIPVNLRTPDEVGLPGNRFFLARVDLPGGPSSAAGRLPGTLAATAPLKSPAHRSALHRLTHRAPRPLARKFTFRAATPDRLTVVGSIFGSRHPLSFLGDPVHRVVPLICCPQGFPLTAALFLYGETSTACFQIDRALPEAHTLPERWRRAVDEITSGGSAGAGP
ncbi:hypothetical protein [Streptomyces acidiscabies]|uniref:hypothetical protein n=1 Tax=Streptomyces acidiscabies TaxID=42234 RepID=UPI0038F6BC9C